MSILLDQTTNILIQGLTGHTARKHAISMKANHTKIIAGVVPGKGGSFVEDWPVYNSVSEALDHHEIDMTLIFAPPRSAATAVLESIEAGIKLIACVTEGIPLHDMLRVHQRLMKSNSLLIGPCSPGITSPGKAKVGFIPDRVCLPGHVGVIGKSGTLTYEICYQLTNEEIGQSTIVGIGGDPIKGLTFSEVLALFEADKETHVIIMVGEIGGQEEEIAAAFIKNHISKPVISFIAGRTAPKDTPMGHAGALISGSEGGYEQKVKVLEESGVMVAHTIEEVVTLVKSVDASVNR